jgi:hypothetical protein
MDRENNMKKKWGLFFRCLPFQIAFKTLHLKDYENHATLEKLWLLKTLPKRSPFSHPKFGCAQNSNIS